MSRATTKKTLHKSHQSKKAGWRIVEEVAALLEKTLAPSAKVEHDVRLPVMGRTRRRQCDVVITYGESPRQTTAIVEVQKRLRKPDLNTFHGWCQKMREVGAQHLICVSEKGYPKSILDDVATTYGPTVRLLTLAELRQPNISHLSLVYPFVLLETPHFILETCGPAVKLESSPSSKQLTLNTNDRIFSVDTSQALQNLNDLIAGAFHRIASQVFLETSMKVPAPYHLELTLGSAESDLWLHLDNQQYKVLALPVRVRVESTVTKIPLTVYSYRQESVDGVLAWVSTATNVSEGKDVTLQVVFKQDDQGFLRIAAIRQEGLETAALIVSNDKATIQSFVSAKLSIAR